MTDDNDDLPVDRGDYLPGEEPEGEEPEGEEPEGEEPEGKEPEGEEPEGEEPGGEEPEGEGAGEAAAAAARAAEEEQRNKFIPRSRFDEVNERMKAAERRLAEMEAAQKAAEEAAAAAEGGAFDFETKEKEYMEAVIDGDQDRALAIRREIREAEKTQLASELGQVDNKARKAAEEQAFQREAQALVAEYNAKYPVFDPESESFNEELTTEAVALIEVYRSKGKSFAEALDLATTKTLKANGLWEDEAPAPTKTPAKPAAKAVQEKLDRTKQPPAKGANRGTAESEPKIEELSDKDFLALPAAVRARLRGDLVA